MASLSACTNLAGFVRFFVQQGKKNTCPYRAGFRIIISAFQAVEGLGVGPAVRCQAMVFLVLADRTLGRFAVIAVDAAAVIAGPAAATAAI